MSLKQKTNLFHKLNYQNIEIMNHFYTRFFFNDDSATAKEFVEEINSRKDTINNKNNTDIKAYVMGKNDSLAMIEDLGTLLERNPEDFRTILTLIKRYIMSSSEGTAQDLINTTRKKRKKSTSDTVVVRKKNKRKTKKKKVSESSETGGLKADGEVEEYIRDYVVKEEVVTCMEMAGHIQENFSDISEDDALQLLYAWAEKNKDNFTYDPDYDDGIGMINLLEM